MSSPIAIALSTPVQLGKEGEPITELVLKPTARAFREFSLQMKEDGGFVFEPYALAKVGIKLAGQSPALLDLMDPSDMMEVATAVMGFIVPSRPTGTVP